MPRRFFLKLITALPSLSLVRQPPAADVRADAVYTDSDGNGSPRLHRDLTDDRRASGVVYGA
jgi:hypothetical protein